MGITLQLVPKYAISIVLLLNLIACGQISDEKSKLVTIPLTESTMIHSTIIDDDFKLYLFFPPSYDTSQREYPVLYLTDGDWNFTHAINSFSNLKQDYFIIEPLIVAIGYGEGKNQRDRDLNPSKAAHNFFEFIKQEVIPYVDQNFRVSQQRALYGYSLGGMFATYVLFEQPELFDTILIGAPGDNGIHLLPAAEKYFRSHSDLKTKIFLGVGAYEVETVQNIELFKDYLIKKVPSATIETVISPGMNHGAAMSSVMQNAIRFAYCQRHLPYSIDPKILITYAGKYTSPEDSSLSYTVLTKANKLFVLLPGMGNEVFELELIPKTDTSFFLIEDQRLLYTFRAKPYINEKFLTIQLKDGKELRLVATK